MNSQEYFMNTSLSYQLQAARRLHAWGDLPEAAQGL